MSWSQDAIDRAVHAHLDIYEVMRAAHAVIGEKTGCGCANFQVHGTWFAVRWDSVCCPVIQ